MDDFKKLPKMQHFKTGGSVMAKPKAMCYGGKAMKKGGEVDAADIKQDKAIVKKAFAMHDKQEHGGDKTDLSKLKRGGRAKKSVGTVKKYKTGGAVTKKADAPSKAEVKGKDFGAKTVGPSGHKDAAIKSKQSGKAAAAPSGAKGGVNKYKTGGAVTNVYEAKKASGDKDNIRKVKEIKAQKLCGGKSVKKMADGGYSGDDPIVKYRMGLTDAQGNPTAAAGSYTPNANPTLDNRDVGNPMATGIDDESASGVVTPAQQAFNKTIPGSGANMAARRRAAPKPGMIGRMLQKPGVKKFLSDFNQASLIGAKKGGKIKKEC